MWSLMWEEFKNKYFSTTPAKIGWGMIILGLFCILVAYLILTIFGNLLSEISIITDFVGFFFTMGFSLISIGVALISTGIALESKDISKKSVKIAEQSKKIADESDTRMKSIANTLFLNAVDKFEDERLQFQRNPLFTPRNHALWKSYTYTIEAKEVMKFTEINEQYQNRFINLFGTLIKIYPWKSKLWAEELQHFLFIHNFMMTLQVDEKKKNGVKNQLIKKFQIYLKKKVKETDEVYLERLHQEINKKIEEKKFREPFIVENQ